MAMYFRCVCVCVGGGVKVWNLYIVGQDEFEDTAEDDDDVEAVPAVSEVELAHSEDLQQALHDEEGGEGGVGPSGKTSHPECYSSLQCNTITQVSRQSVLVYFWVLVQGQENRVHDDQNCDRCQSIKNTWLNFYSVVYSEA